MLSHEWSINIKHLDDLSSGRYLRKQRAGFLVLVDLEVEFEKPGALLTAIPAYVIK